MILMKKEDDVNLNWYEHFKEGKELVLATCSKKGEPNANITLSLGFVDNKLLIADCQMHTTIKNLKENNKICIVAGYYKIKGHAELFTSGEYFDICLKKITSPQPRFKPKTAILVTVDEVFDLDKVVKIK